MAALQGNLSQNARDRVMDDFRSGAGADPAGDQRRRARAGRQPRGAGDQLRAAGIARAAHPPRRPHRPHGAAGAGDHAARPGGPHQVAAAGARVHPPHQRAPWRGAKALLADGNGNGHAEMASETTIPVATPPAAQVREAARPAARRPARPRAGKQRHARVGSTIAREPLAARARVTADTAPELEGRELLRRYGRDPRRPDWVDAERGVASATASAGRWHGSGPHRSGARGDVISRSAPPAARPRRRPFVPIRRGRSTATAATTSVRETRRAAVASPAV